MKIFLISTAVLFLTIFSLADSFAQCGSAYVLAARHRPPLQQDTTKTIIINSKKYFVFADTNWTSISKWDINDTSLYDGNWVLLSHNNPNKILLQITYKNKLIDGKVISKRANGTLLGEWNYNNGKLDGQQKSYFENGQIDDLNNYKNGLTDGEQKSFWEDGSLSSISDFINGKREGIYKGWHSNGRQYYNGNYKNGHKQGEYYEWDEEGRIVEFTCYNDTLELISLRFENGKLVNEKYFSNGKLTRWVYDYYTTPQEYFISKRKHKTEYDFEKIERTIKKEAIYQDTLITDNTYYPSGKLKSEEYYVYKGQVDCKDIYHKVGTHKFWTADGKLEKELHYKDDKLIDK